MYKGDENTGYIYCDTDADSGICNVIVLTIFSVVISCDFGSNVLIGASDMNIKSKYDPGFRIFFVYLVS